jgi:hypothetical protein
MYNTCDVNNEVVEKITIWVVCDSGSRDFIFTRNVVLKKVKTKNQKISYK